MKEKMEECTKNCMLKASKFLPEMFERIQKNLAPLQPPSSEFTRGTILDSNSGVGSIPGLSQGKMPGLSPGASPMSGSLIPGLSGTVPAAGIPGLSGTVPTTGIPGLENIGSSANSRDGA